MEVTITIPAEQLIKEMFWDYVTQRKMPWEDPHEMSCNINVFGLFVENTLRDMYLTDDEPEWEVD